MNLQIPPEQLAIVEDLVANGRFASLGEAVAEGIRLLANSEKLRSEVQRGVDAADRGELQDHDTVFANLRTMVQSSSDQR